MIFSVHPSGTISPKNTELVHDWKHTEKRRNMADLLVCVILRNRSRGHPSLCLRIREFRLWKQVCIHYNEVAGASGHDEQVKDFVAAEILVPAVEQRELQSVDHTAHGIDNTSCE